MTRQRSPYLRLEQRMAADERAARLPLARRGRIGEGYAYIGQAISHEHFMNVPADEALEAALEAMRDGSDDDDANAVEAWKAGTAEDEESAA